MKSKILLIGAGSLGSATLELLVRSSNDLEVVVGARNRASAERACNLARLGAIAQGFEPKLRLMKVDLDCPDELAQSLKAEKPDIVLNTASMLTWWLPGLLPSEAAAKLQQAPFGAWLPAHLAPALKLMRVIRASGFTGTVVSAPFPDAVNCVLGRMNLAPTCGVGNVDEIAVKIKFLAAQALGASLHEIKVVMVAHHSLERYVFEGFLQPEQNATPPYILKVFHNDRDVSEQLDLHELLFRPFPLTSGTATHFFTAGSTVRLLQALRSDEVTFLHAPGPNGLAGGYPVRVGKFGVALETGSIGVSESIKTNELAQKYDGIESIESDGTVVFTRQAYEGMKAALGIEMNRLAVGDVAAAATELVAAFRGYARSYGKEL